MAQSQQVVGFSERDARRVASATRIVEGLSPCPPERLRPRPGGIYRPSWWRIIAVESATAYTVRKQEPDETTLALADITESMDPDYELDRKGWTPGIATATWRIDQKARGDLFYMPTENEWGVILDLPLVFPVTLTQTGGAQGDETDPATWTYTVADALDSRSLDTAVSPVASPHLWQRPAAGFVLAATAGLATCNAAGELVLLWTNEVADQEAC